MRLGDMSMADMEQAGQRFYAAKGRRAGEDSDAEIDYEADDPYDEIIAEPDERLQPWEVEG